MNAQVSIRDKIENLSSILCSCVALISLLLLTSCNKERNTAKAETAQDFDAIPVVANPIVKEELPLPEFYGTYIIENGKLFRLQKGQEGPHLGKSIKFLVYSTSAPETSEQLELKTRGPEEITAAWKSQPKPMTERRVSKTPNIDFLFKAKFRKVSLRAKPVPNQPHMAIVVPEEPLAFGAYFLSTGEEFCVGSQKEIMASLPAEAQEEIEAYHEYARSTVVQLKVPSTMPAR